MPRSVETFMTSQRIYAANMGKNEANKLNKKSIGREEYLRTEDKKEERRAETKLRRS